MKILLTAPARIGKTILIEAVAQNLSPRSFGIVSREVLNEAGGRIGFAAVNRESDSRLFMLRSDLSLGKVAAPYNVYTSVIDTFMVPELERGLTRINSLLYIDEIGSAQMRSPKFLDVVRSSFNTQNDILASVIYEDAPESMEFKRREDVCLVEVTKENRNPLLPILTGAFQNSAYFKALMPQQQCKVYELLIRLLAQKEYISAEKLFTKALCSVARNKVQLVRHNGSSAEYRVVGQEHNHTVNWQKGVRNFSCDCDLYKGLGKYKGHPQTCSHEISVLIWKADTSIPRQSVNHLYIPPTPFAVR